MGFGIWLDKIQENLHYSWLWLKLGDDPKNANKCGRGGAREGVAAKCENKDLVHLLSQMV